MREYFNCSCHHPCHLLVLDLEDDVVDGLSFSFILNCDWGILKRLKLALKYVFGYTSDYGHYVNLIMENEDCLRLKKLLETYLEKKNDSK